MGDPKSGGLAVRISTIGHASPRWKGAKNPTEADHLNQRLSELRADNVSKAVAELLKSELPRLPIEVPSKGVGSRERFPTASEDNAAVDRSVLITVELTTTNPSYKFQPRGPQRIYVPSKIWTLEVRALSKGAALGYVQIFLRIALRNPYSGKEITLAGWLAGGGSAMNLKDSFKVSKTRQNPSKPVGRKVSYFTREAMDFDDWRSVGARMGNLDLRPGGKNKRDRLLIREKLMVMSCDPPQVSGRVLGFCHV
jgi:hypothetical protein